MYATESENDVKYPVEHCFFRSGLDSNVDLGENKSRAPNYFARISVYVALPKTL